MRDIRVLRSILQRIDRRGYKAYEEIRGVYQDGEVVLAIDHVQGDPFASPSRVRLIVERRHLVLTGCAGWRSRTTLPGGPAKRSPRWGSAAGAPASPASS